MTDRLAILYDEIMLQHSNGTGHPERPDRLARCADRLRAANLPETTWHRPRQALRDELLRIHTPAHLDYIFGLKGQTARIDEDTAVVPASVEAALAAAGAAMDAVDLVMDGAARKAFALVRPPGHHAEPGTAMGFCLFNNIAAAAAHARAELDIQRVMIIDWDVHHGNGTQDIFYEDPNVLFFSTHQAPYFPNTGAARERGAGAGLGYTVNLPLPAGTGDGDMFALYRSFIPALARQFEPQLILVSAGFDAHGADPLADFTMTADGFAGLMALVDDVAEEVCDGRVVCVLEGGYELSGLSQSVLACARQLSGAAPRARYTGTGRIAELVLKHAPALHEDTWKIEPA